MTFVSGAAGNEKLKGTSLVVEASWIFNGDLSVVDITATLTFAGDFCCEGVEFTTDSGNVNENELAEVLL